MNWINSEKQESEKARPFTRWVSWIFLAAFVLLFIYTYYHAEIIFHGARWGVYLKYYLVSLVGILFWGMVLRLQERIRANIVTVVITLVIGVYMVEGGVRLLKSPSHAAAAAELGIEYDQRTKLEVIEDLIAKEMDAVPAVYPSDLIKEIGVNEKDIGKLLPLAGVSNKITVSSNESGKYLIYRSDRYGFNNPDDQWDAKTVEWLLTGDSFTHGFAVQQGQEIAGQIRSITNNTAISLGITGNGPLVEYAVLVEHGKELSPAKVLWVYYEGNDLQGDLSQEKINPLLIQYMEDGFSQNLINRQKEVDSRLEEYIVSIKAALKSSDLYNTKWLRLYAIRNLIGANANANSDDLLFTKILTKAKARVETWGGELYFVYLPEYARYKNKGVSHDEFRRKSKVIDLVKGLKIPVIDIHQEVFKDRTNPLSLFPFGLSGHYNAEGYAEVTKAIVDNVKKHEDLNNKAYKEN